jgi:hypothetical protein
MIAQLRNTMGRIGVIHNLNEHQMENLAAILFIQHYKHPIPSFDEQDVYIKELEGVAPLKKTLKTLREQRDVSFTKWFHKEHIIV